MSTTMYFHPYFARCAAIQSALAFTFSSRTVVPYESQLFHPMGGADEDCARAKTVTRMSERKRRALIMLRIVSCRCQSAQCTKEERWPGRPAGLHRGQQ